MISLIERGESSATAVVLGSSQPGSACHSPRCSMRPPRQIRSDIAPQGPGRMARPASGYIRRNVSPAGFSVTDPRRRGVFPAARACAYETGARAPA